MRLSKQNAIVYYGDQERLINRNCQNQLMFLQGVKVQLNSWENRIVHEILYCQGHPAVFYF